MLFNSPRGKAFNLVSLCTNEEIRFNEFKKLLPGKNGTVLADGLLELKGV
jgi:hypothetical protein